MATSLLVRLIGFSAMLIHGDTLVLDRWRWLRNNLGASGTGRRLIDIGCGSGAFTIGAARLGYHATGLTWNAEEQGKATARSAIAKTAGVRFETYDVRRLDLRRDLAGKFDVAICLENIEHILDDEKLMRETADLIKPGGTLLLTTPNFDFRPISREDEGPVSTVETGGHVRRGYTEGQLRDLCDRAGLVPVEISYCSGFLSQKITGVLRALARVSYPVAWLIVLPLRLLPPILDRPIERLTGWPGYSICLVARKPDGNGADGAGA